MPRKVIGVWAGFPQGKPAHVTGALTLWVWTTAFLFYAATTSLHILPADSGEFQLVAATWGIAHPPGYPLYTILSALWTRLLPVGPLPFRTSLLSAALAATTLSLTLRAVIVWARALGASSRHAVWGGVAATLALGTATTFWHQATLANIRMPALLFTAWGFLALAHYRAAGEDRRRQDRALVHLALATGLGAGHHPSLAFVALGWGLYLVLLTPRLITQPSRLLRPLGIAAAAWIIPQLYLPLRGSMAGVALNPSGLATWAGFWNHVLARGFGGDMFAFVAPYHLALRAPLLPTLFRIQFPALILAVISVGWLWLLFRSPRLAISLFASWLIQSYVTITYRAPQTIEYLMPAYVPMVLVLGLTLALLPRELRHRSKTPVRGTRAALLLTGIVLLAQAAQVPGHIRDFGTLANDTTVRDRVAPLLAQSAPESPAATVLADWHWATPLWLLQTTEDLGTDANVLYVVPEPGREYEEAWRTLAENADEAPLLSTHAYDWEGWSFAPVGGGFRLYRRPLTALPEELAFAPIDADLGPLRLLGYRWYGDTLPGGTVELQLAWQVLGAGAPSFATRLWSSDATLISAADQRLEIKNASGEVRFTRLTHQIPPFGCVGDLTPTISTYTVETGEFRELGAVTLPPLATGCRTPKLPTGRIWPGLVLTRGPFLRGLDYDTRTDGNTTAYLHWCGPGAALTLHADEVQSQVGPLALGECETMQVPVTSPDTLLESLARPDGSPARYIGLPLPQPLAGERYLPFGRQMVLVGDSVRSPLLAPAFTLESEGAELTLLLFWRTVTPLQDDYAVSVRLLDADNNWLGMHDMQPGLGAIPTLKWVTQGNLIRDPHPIAYRQGMPVRYAVVVYERFRLTTLRSAQGDIAVYELR